MRIHSKNWMKLLEKTQIIVEVFIDELRRSFWPKVKKFSPVFYLKIPSYAGMKQLVPKAFLKYSFEKTSSL